ncbi:hypothetical protein C0991_009369 [Blastosporella zonata]|nr:hypothetical protein C0991_009369 [Blastosporella zonata]
MDAYARSISTIWLVLTPIIGASFVMGPSLPLQRALGNSPTFIVLFIRVYSLQRTVVRQEEPKTDVEEVVEGASPQIPEGEAEVIQMERLTGDIRNRQPSTASAEKVRT